MGNDSIENKALTLTKDYVESYKYSKWLEYYTDEKNPKTYSNGVQSALAAYGNITYGTASQIATDNKKKFKYSRQMFAEKSGFTFEKFQKATIAKFLRSEKPEWFDKVKQITGYADEIPEQPKGQGVAFKTEDKNGNVTEVRVVSFEQPKND